MTVSPTSTLSDVPSVTGWSLEAAVETLITARSPLELLPTTVAVAVVPSLKVT